MLQGKYLKYTEDITLEIFTKIIERLNKAGWKCLISDSVDNQFNRFTSEGYLIYSSDENKYSFYVDCALQTTDVELKVSDVLEPQFEVGKWYKWYQTNHENFHIGKFKELTDSSNSFYMEPWISSNTNYIESGCFILKFAEQIQELTLEEIQQYLPDNYPDKVVKEFVLPEKWVVKRTSKNQTVLNKWANNQPGVRGTDNNNGWIHSINYGYCGHSGKGHYYADDVKHSEHTEITFEQFKQYVLKESVKEEVKPIEKWSVGSYVVFCENNSQGNSFKKGDIAEISRFISGKRIYYRNNKTNDFDYINRNIDFFKWFATLPEAEAFSKSLLEPEEPKPLSVDDLVEGEIYLVEYSSGNQFINLSNGKNHVKCYINVKNKEYHKSSTCNGASNYRIATPEEKNWLLTCIKQDKFIPQDQLDMYDYEGNLIEDKPKTKPFEFNKWYKSNNADGLFFIQSKNTGYGFRSNHVNYWFTNNKDFEWNTDGLELAENSLVEERLISYAKEKYPVGTKYIGVVNHNEEKVSRIPTRLYHNFNNGFLSIEIGIDYIFYRGKWAEIVSIPVEESKKFDRNWYVEVNSQEEANAIFDYLEAQGEKVDRAWNKFDHLWKYIVVLHKSPTWILTCDNNCFDRGFIEKQLSDILGDNKPYKLGDITNKYSILSIPDDFEWKLIPSFAVESKPEPRVKLINVPKI